MKLFNKIFLGAAAIAVAIASYSCKEEATLADADAVYITMAQTDISILVGDTIRLSATVQNASGDVIETPIQWSSSDESVCKIIDIVEYEYEPNPDYVAPDDAGSPDEGGEGDETIASEDAAGEPEFIVSSETHYVGLVAVPGAQGKMATIKATLENGMYAITPVTIGRNALSGSIAVFNSESFGEGDFRHNRHSLNRTSYISKLNDTLWFAVDPIQLVDDYELSYSLDITETIATGDDPAENEFSVSDNPIYIDREYGMVGVVFTAPRMTGKATCTLTLSIDKDGVSESESCTNEFVVCPPISAGLVYLNNGQKVYPLYSAESPSNLKPKQSSASLDINSSHLVEVAMGIESGRDDDISLAIAAEKAGYFSWNIDGNAVIVEAQDTTFYKTDVPYDDPAELKYMSGYITYLKVKSGTRPGKVRAIFAIPGQDFVCDLDIIDFKKDYPVEQIVIKDGEEEVGDTYELDLSIKTMTLSVTTIPDASFSFHIPAVESSNTAVLEPSGRDGNNYMFAVKGAGTAKLTFKSIDVVREVNVTVNDAIELITLPSNPVSVYVGDTYEITSTLRMFSGATNTQPVTFVSSDENIATVALKPGTNNIGVINGKAVGEVEIYAVCGDIRSNSVKVSVSEISDINVISLTGAGSGGVLRLNLTYGSSSADRANVTIPLIASNYGQYTGNDASVKVGTVTTDGCGYNFTLTQVDAQNATINGYIQMPNGMKYLMDNLTFRCTIR